MSPEGAGSGGRLLVVPGDPRARTVQERCAASLRKAGYLVHAAATLRDAARERESGDPEAGVVILAAGEEGRRGPADLMSWAGPDLPLVITGVADGAASRAMILAGAAATLPDPSAESDLLDAVERAIGWARSERKEARYDPSEPDLERLIGAGPEVQPVLRIFDRAANSPSPALLIGEVGSGKQLLARALHERGRRRTGPFVKCHISALVRSVPDDEARVFGAFLGSVARPGFLERAHGGTLFVDEIALLPESLQALIVDLQAAGESATITPDGGSGTPADLRLVAGASREPADGMRQGDLRRDLRDLISVLPIRLPPLRSRVRDIPILAGALVARFASRLGRPVVGLTPAAVSMLQRYHWPGNIRELEEQMERAVRRATGPALRPDDLADLSRMLPGASRNAPTGTIDLELSLDETLSLKSIGRMAGAAAEIMAIECALKATGGNVTHAARRLKVSRLHLQKRMKRYGLRKET